MSYIELNLEIDKMTPDQKAFYFAFPDRTKMTTAESIDLARKIVSGAIKESASPVTGEVIKESVMESLYKKLQTAVDAMSESQRTEYYKESKTRKSIEAKVVLAEHVLANKPRKVKQTFTGKRNNGAVLPVSESEQKTAELREEQYKAYRKAGLSEAVARDMSGFGGGNIPDKITEAGPRAVADFLFLKDGLHMQEADAIRGALSNVTRKPEEQIRD